MLIVFAQLSIIILPYIYNFIVKGLDKNYTPIIITIVKDVLIILLLIYIVNRNYRPALIILVSFILLVVVVVVCLLTILYLSLENYDLINPVLLLIAFIFI